jgi:hypothetical protein
MREGIMRARRRASDRASDRDRAARHFGIFLMVVAGVMMTVAVVTWKESRFRLERQIKADRKANHGLA